MKVNINNGITEREQVTQGGGTFIAANLIRESEMFDRFGNVIDPKTKQILKKNNDVEQYAK